MDTSLDLLFSALLLTAKVLSVGTISLYLITVGNPSELKAGWWILQYIYAAPPITLFRWHPPEGYQVVVYHADTDEEKVKPALFQPIRWSPTYLLWPKKRSQSREVMLRAARLAFFLRLAFFGCFFLGSFCLLGWLTVTESRRWLVAMVVLAVHQFVFSRSNRYFVWQRTRLLMFVGPGAWVYLQGGAYETIAVFAVGAVMVLHILIGWWMATSWRWQTSRDLGLGVFDPSRQRKRW